MRSRFQLLETKLSVANGAAVNVEGLLHKTVQIDGPFTATFQVQISLNGDDYYPAGSALSAPGIVNVPETCAWIRIATTAWTSGTPSATLGAFEARSDV